MQVEVKGRRLWFDVEGAALVPDGSEMRDRPTVVLLHGGPGSFDLPGHGRSEWGDPAGWSFEDVPDRYWPLLMDFLTTSIQPPSRVH